MSRHNSASRPDLQEALEKGIKSQHPGPVPKPSSLADDAHDNKTSGAGILIRRVPNKRRR